MRLVPWVWIAACQDQAANVSANRENAGRWVADLLPGYEVAGFSSATLDVDGDGYVTVDVTVRKVGQSELVLVQLDCPTAGVLLSEKGSACKFASTPLANRF